MTVIIPVKIAMQGHFKLTAIDAVTGKVRELADFDNLIVNQGLDYVATGSPGTVACVYYGCVVGTGTTPAAPTDTNLQTFLAGTRTVSTNSVSNVGNPTYATVTSTTYQFAAGVAAGNLTEIGICATGTGQSLTTVPTNASPLFSHSLIMVGGVPGTVTILATEVLNVVYTLTMFPIVTTLTGSFNLNTNGTITSVNYSILSASVSANNYTIASSQTKISNNSSADNAYPSTSVLGPVTGVPTGTNAIFTGSSLATAAYVPGNYFLSYTLNVPIGGGNTTTNSIGAMGLFIQAGNYTTPLQIAFSPAIAKNNTQTFSIVVNVSWSN